jgi:hypothetical protein
VVSYQKAYLLILPFTVPEQLFFYTLSGCYGLGEVNKMVISNRRFNLIQWLLVLTPVIIMIFCGLVGYSVAQQNKAIDSKANKARVDDLCKVVEKKVDNETLLQMIKALGQKDDYLAEENRKQDIRINRQENIQMEQLKVLGDIKVEMEKLNGKVGK